MSAMHGEGEGRCGGQRLADGELGAVTLCDCGIVTLTLTFVSIRLEVAALHEMIAMLSRAAAALDRRIDGACDPVADQAAVLH